MKNATNLLEGSIFGRLTRLAMPIMMTAFVQMAYNLVDMIWIGGLGSGAVAAVGAAGIYLWIADSCTSVAKTGGQIKVAHSIGEGNEDKARSFAAGAFQMGVFIILICMAVVVCGHQLMVGVFQFTDEVIHNNAVSYLLITGTAGIFFSTVNQVFTGVYTGLGDSKSPFWTTAVGLVLNLILDPVLIFGVGPIPAMGVIGAALATAGAQGVVTLLFIVLAKKQGHFFVGIPVLKKPDWEHIRAIWKLGLPVGIQNVFYIMALIAVNLAVMNMLPIPALDGGRVLFVLLNGISYLLFRRQIPQRLEGYVHAVALVLLLVIMLLIAFQDVWKIVV